MTATVANRPKPFVNGKPKALGEPPANGKPIVIGKPAPPTSAPKTATPRPTNRIEPFVNGKPKSGGEQPIKGKPSSNGKPSPPATAPEPKSTTTQPATSPPTTERNEAGRFKQGCKPGPGNPFAKRVATLRKSLLDSVTEADVASLGKKLLAQAMEGDVAAAKVLLSYIVGKPTEVVDPDRIEIEAWKLVMSWPTLSDTVAGMTLVRPEAAVESAQQYAPSNADDILPRIANPKTLKGGLRVIRRREEKGK